MHPHGTADWIRNEHKAVNHLMDRVKSAVDPVPATERHTWLDALRQNFGRLRAHFKEHIKAEEYDGFMGPVLERRPTLSREVRHLKDEHVELVASLDRIWQDLIDLQPNDTLPLEDACHRIRHLISAIEHHEEHEELLVTFVFSQDIGTSD